LVHLQFVGGPTSFLDKWANPDPTHVCRNCGNAVRPLVSNKVNGCFFVVLLFLFVIPGILYLFWAGGQTFLFCPKCNAKDCFVPLGAPEAQRIQIRSVSQETAIPTSTRVERPCPWCAEPILVAAKVCKHCGRDVHPTLTE
jgi:hypothetical protein